MTMNALMLCLGNNGGLSDSWLGSEGTEGPWGCAGPGGSPGDNVLLTCLEWVKVNFSNALLSDLFVRKKLLFCSKMSTQVETTKLSMSF